MASGRNRIVINMLVFGLQRRLLLWQMEVFKVQEGLSPPWGCGTKAPGQGAGQAPPRDWSQAELTPEQQPGAGVRIRLVEGNQAQTHPGWLGRSMGNELTD